MKIKNRFTLLLSILIMIAIPNLLSAQWNLFPHNQISYYASDSMTSDYENIYRIKQDSTMQTGGWNILFFNRFVNSNSHNSCYYEPQRNYFNRDTLYLDSLFEQNGDYQYFANGDTSIFYTQATTGQSWIVNCANGGTNYSLLKFTCISITEDTIFSITDSVKSLLIETLPTSVSPVDSFVIKISKNYGLLNMIPFYYLLNHFYPSVPPVITLRGFETDTSRVGYTFPRFEEFFDIHTGTIIKHESETNSNGLPPFEYHYRDSVTNVINISDSVITVYFYSVIGTTAYVFNGLNYIPINDCCDSGNFSISYFRKDYEQLLLKGIHEINYQRSNAYNLYTYTTPIWGANTNNINNDNYSRSYSLIGELDTTNCNNLLDPVVFEGCEEFTLISAIGEYIFCYGHVTQSGWSGSNGYLNGYCIDGVCTGDVSNLISGISDSNPFEIKFISVYPNPATDYLTITSASIGIATITVTDISGRQLITTQTNLKSQIINLKSFSPGIYLLHYSDGINQQVKKFVVER